MMPIALMTNSTVWVSFVQYWNRSQVGTAQCNGYVKSRSKEKLEVWGQKPYDFDRNKKKEAHYLKTNSQTPQEKKPREFKLTKYIWLLGQKPCAYLLKGL